jgi:glycosyltransferase involved in cell wall biosynthesis
MKILQVNSVCGYGSTGKIVADLYRMLQEKGHDCLIAYGRGSAPSELKTVRIGSAAGQYWHALQTRLFDRHGFASRRATMHLIETVKRYSPDVIHLHNLHGYYLNIKILFEFLAQAQIPVVWTLHDCWAFTGHCAYFDYAGCEKWQSACHACSQGSQYPKSMADRSAKNYEAKRALFTSVEHMRIVTPSQWLAGLVRQSFLSKYPVQVVHNGVDLSVFKPVSDQNTAWRTKPLCWARQASGTGARASTPL